MKTPKFASKPRTSGAFAALLAFAAFPAAFAGEVAWTGDNTYNIPAGDTMTFSSDETITAASTFTGSGTIVVSGGTLTLAYAMDAIPFSGFTGTVRIDSGATVYVKGGDGFKEDGTYANSAFGPSAAIEFNGGTYKGFKQENNSQFPAAIVLADDTESTIDNNESRGTSGNFKGVNLRIRSTASFSGSGKLTINSGWRFVEFASGVDFSGLTGEIALTGISEQDVYFYGTGYGASALWTLDAHREFKIGPGNWNTSVFGAMVVTDQAKSVNFTNTGTTLQIGARGTTPSRIDAPFAGNSFTLNKVGADTSLTLGENVSFVSGTVLDMDEGTLVLDGCDISGVTADFASGTTLKVTANDGTIALGSALSNLDLTDGAIAVAAGNGWETGTTHDLFTYSGAMEGFAPGKVVVRDLGGNADVTISDDNGTVKATVIAPTLYWSGAEGANWADADAWESADGESRYTFSDGDRVALRDGDTIPVSSEVKPGNLAVSGTVTLTGSGTVETVALANGGTLNVAGNITLKATPAGGTINVADGATLRFCDARTIETGPVFTGTGTVVFDGANVLLHHTLLNASVPFANFAGTVRLENGAVVEQSGDGFPYPSDRDGDISGPFGDSAKIVFAGGTLQGFKVVNNIFFHNEIEVLESANDNWLRFPYANSYSQRPNVRIYSKFTGAGTLKIKYDWDAANKKNRRLYFMEGCDMTAFAGTIFLSGGHYYQFEMASGYGENATVSFDTAYAADGVLIQPPSGTTMKFGAFNYSREGERLEVWSDRNDYAMTMEVGAKNEDCTIDTKFLNKPFSLVKKGDAKLTFGAGFGMVSGSTVEVAAGTLEVNCTETLAASVAVKAGAALKGAGKLGAVSFEDGAFADFGITAETDLAAKIDGPTAASFTWTAAPSVAQPDSSKGKWVVRKRNNGDGTVTLYAEFARHGFAVILADAAAGKSSAAKIG